MKRTNKPTKVEKQVDLIITGDWHLMEEDRQLPCRTDRIWDAQWKAVDEIAELQKECNCFVFHSGDLFDHWKTSPNLLNMTIRRIPKSFQTIIGNHDMPQHNFELMNKSGLSVLIETKIIGYLQGINWGSKEIKYFDYISRSGYVRKIVITHEMTYLKEKPWPDCEDPECNFLFKKYPKADLIITGHNHQTFTAQRGDRLLINPGSLTQHKADQIDHRPCVFLWDAETNTAKPHYLSIDNSVIQRGYIEEKQKKEKHISDFLDKLKNSWEVGLSFEDNILRAMEDQKLGVQIKEIILNWMNK